MHEKTLNPDILGLPFSTALGEGPYWDGSRLGFVDILGRKLHTATLDGTQVTTHDLPQLVGFAVPHAEGGWVAGFTDGLWRSSADGSRWEQIWQAPHSPATHRFNDGKTDPRGRVWFGSMTYAEDEPTSALYRWDAEGVSQQVSGITTSNGLDWSPDRRTFYYTDSIPRVIWAFDYDDESGTIGNRRVFAQDPDGYVPDGGTIDDEGCFWSAKWNGARLVRYAPDGRVDLVWHLPVNNPTSCCFVGPDRSILAVTTATPPDSTRASELDGRVLLIPTTTTGPAATSASI